MDERKLIDVAKALLEDQESPILKAEMRREGDGTRYVAILQDQGIGGVKKFIFYLEDLLTIRLEKNPQVPLVVEAVDEPVKKPLGKRR